MPRGDLQEMEVSTKQSKTAVNAKAGAPDAMPKLTTGGIPPNVEDLGGPSPDNYKPDDDSAKLKPPGATLKQVKDVVNKGAKSGSLPKDEKPGANEEVVSDESVIEEEEVTTDEVVAEEESEATDEVVAEEETSEEEVIEEEETIDIEADVQALLEGEELSEEFQDKARTIFEGAIRSKVAEIKEELQESYAVALVEELDKIKEGLTERVDSYLNYVITEWVKENELALENGIRNEINESFINGLKTLFETHNISYPDSQVSVVDGLYEQMQQEQLKREELAKYYDNKINEEMQKNIELNEEIEDLRRDQIIREATEDLPLSQVDRLESLAEDVDFVDENSFAKSMKTLRESYVPSKRNLVIQDDIDMLAEGNTSENTETEDLSESMQSYSQALSRYGKN